MNTKSRTVTDAVNSYSSTCCHEPSTKPPCEQTREDHKEGKKNQSSLGTWRCSRCKRKCSVTRSKNKPVELEVAA